MDKGTRWGRYYAAAQRHLNAFWAGEDMDPESGLPHLAHAMWCCATLLDYSKDHKDMDDRKKPKEK